LIHGVTVSHETPRESRPIRVYGRGHERHRARFAVWDGEAAAADYAAGDPARVARQVAESIEAYAAAHDGLDRASCERGGVRSDGERFTVTTLARYGLHEVCQHAWDVGIDRRD
jgi:hypothetical protein